MYTLERMLFQCNNFSVIERIKLFPLLRPSKDQQN